MTLMPIYEQAIRSKSKPWWLLAAARFCLAGTAITCPVLTEVCLGQDSYGDPSQPVSRVESTRRTWTAIPVGTKSPLPASPWQEAPRSSAQNIQQPPVANAPRLIRQPSRRGGVANGQAPLQIQAPQANPAPARNVLPEEPAYEEVLPTPTELIEGIEISPSAGNGQPRSVPIAPYAGSTSPIEREWQGLPRNGIAIADDNEPMREVSSPNQLPVGLRMLPPTSSLPSTSELGQAVLPTAKESLESIERERVTQLAEKVSKEILASAKQPSADSPEPLEAPVGSQALERELRYRLKRCDDLLRRGATRSARQETIAAIRILLRAIDVRRGNWTSEPAFDTAMLALKEEHDFFQPIANLGQAPSTSMMVEGHQTLVLKSMALDDVPPELAAQYYRAYAREQLVLAANGSPYAADVYYALGKTLEKQAAEEPSKAVIYRGQAIVCYQAALSVATNHPDAATQLSFVLLQLDRTSEAEEVIAASLQQRNNPNDWRNLVEVYRRQGNSAGHQWAMQQLAVAERSSSSPSQSQQMVQQISPDEFVRISPFVNANQVPSMSNNQSNLNMAANGNATVGANSTNRTSRMGWASKIFR